MRSDPEIDRSSHPARWGSGYTLLELLVSMSIFTILMLSAAVLLQETNQLWTRSSTRINQFQEARRAFERLTRTLSQSTLNTYYGYLFEDSDQSQRPTGYGRKSELQFCVQQTEEAFPDGFHTTHAVFFQAPLGESRALPGLEGLLNAHGYFIEYGSDSLQRPSFLNDLPLPPPLRWRFRLMEYVPPAEENQVYLADVRSRVQPKDIRDWYDPEVVTLYKRPLVENVIALILTPLHEPKAGSDSSTKQTELAPNYEYDSRNEASSHSLHLLPPIVRVTLVAIDESSALYLESTHAQATMPPLLDSRWFRKAEDYDQDLQSLEDRLNRDSLSYRIFTTTVTLRAAKWSP